MERITAVKKLSKMLGKNFGYQIDTKALMREERDAIKRAWDVAIKERDALKEKRDARYKAILAADAEYQELSRATKNATDRAYELSGKLNARKITVGISNSLFFHVKASGDSWEEVIEKVQKGK